MVARLQFVATWVRFDTSFTVGQLACFFASARSQHFEALHHLAALPHGVSREAHQVKDQRRPHVLMLFATKTGE